MHGTDGGALKRQAGFTILELLAVMVILALAASAFSLSVGRPFGTAQFRAILLETSSLARRARTAAIGSARDQILVIDVAKRRLWYRGATKTVTIPDEVMLAATVAQSEHYADGTVGIRFLPGGGSTGGNLVFSWRSDSYEVHVNWLTGSVSIDRG